MRQLQLGNFKDSLNNLLEAEALSDTIENNAKLSAITLNNLGCYHKRQGKPKKALGYLQRALELERESNQDLTNIAGTHLNMCAIQSELGRHEDALVNAAQALNILSKEYDPSPNAISTLIIAYHNLGVENEFLNQKGEAMDAYKLGLELAAEKLGPNAELTVNLRESFLKTCGPSPALHQSHRFRSAHRPGTVGFSMPRTRTYKPPSTAKHS
jgi:tetratricopeptide (TPR) repeat protein